MTVYVDDVEHRFGRLVMCHLWADTRAELLAMVDAIGVQRRWIQEPPRASWLHFDISKTKKAKAIALGAVLTDRYGPVEHLARMDAESGDPDRVARGRARLEQIRGIRERRAG